MLHSPSISSSLARSGDAAPKAAQLSGLACPRQGRRRRRRFRVPVLCQERRHLAHRRPTTEGDWPTRRARCCLDRGRLPGRIGGRRHPCPGWCYRTAMITAELQYTAP